MSPVRNKTKETGERPASGGAVSNGVSSKQLIKESKHKKTVTHDQLLDLEAKYCSWGDTVHYAEKLNIFKSADGSYLYDRQGTEYKERMV